MNPVTGAVPPLIRGHGIRFEIDRWTWRRLDAARFDGERRHLLATRGRPWHADPEHGGETDALETWRLLADAAARLARPVPELPATNPRE